VTKQITVTKQFRKDTKRAAKRGKDLEKIKTVIGMLAEGLVLPPSYKDHALKGKLIPARECHIEPDWLLVYEVTNEEIELIMHGTHSDLFNE
jgi:mRNA interferase YafQ